MTTPPTTELIEDSTALQLEGVGTLDLVVINDRAMASDIKVLAPRSNGGATVETIVNHAMSIFHEVEESCTRFSPESHLMRANRAGGSLCRVDRHCYSAVEHAYSAYVDTSGVFDPRVIDDLVRLGYKDSFELGQRSESGMLMPLSRDAHPPWRPRFEPTTTQLSVGDIPIDLGGIGKGLAVRWCSDLLDASLDQYLIDAGGDCYVRGAPRGLDGWRIGIERPVGVGGDVAVVELHDIGCATSSIRVRRWKVGSREIHHLIDPRNGEPGGEGLVAVTVVHPDPALAEVWSKALFLEGADHIADKAERLGLGAFWIYEGGSFQYSPAMEQHLIWVGT